MARLMVAAEMEQLVRVEGEAPAGEMEAELGVVVTVGEAKAGMEQNEAEEAADASPDEQRVGEKEEEELVVAVQSEAWKRGANGGGGDGGGDGGGAGGGGDR